MLVSGAPRGFQDTQRWFQVLLGGFKYTQRYVEDRIHWQIMSNAVLLEGVPTRVTRVSMTSTSISYVYASPNIGLLIKRPISMFKDVRTSLEPKKNSKIWVHVDTKKFFDTTCGVPC
jgi:hypothetical protein